MDSTHFYRWPIMALAMAALLTGVWMGLPCLGWDMTPLRPGRAVFTAPTKLGIGEGH